MPTVTKPTVVYEDEYMRVVRRADRPHQRAYFDVEIRYTDAMGVPSWQQRDSLGRDDSETHGRDWLKQLLARIMDAQEPGQETTHD
jgi:hypothetical protein